MPGDGPDGKSAGKAPLIADAGAKSGGTTAGGGQTRGGAPAPGGGRPREFVLAISWQPAFCETHANKAECRSQTATRFDADHFTLHGLWPQPRGREYCGVSARQRSDDRAGRWEALPEVAVDAETRAALAEVMPGTRSALERHEWLRHGTCSGTSQDAYFDDALALVGAINASKVRDLFGAKIGGSLTQAEIRAAFDESFGAGAGKRVRIACSRDGDRRLIGELTIGLVGEIRPDPDLAALISAARPTDGGCNDGVVDAVGLQ
ncbi:ribonuclease [Jiella sp. MQZ13P-4]|uniref:Ribonuclease n=2 Tax=Jiella sonneratiae TaxID=2816856 RepID=A0ABS3IZ66_9HYPH|nr:ribonuclease [Jiella sonneratiae]